MLLQAPPAWPCTLPWMGPYFSLLNTSTSEGFKNHYLWKYSMSSESTGTPTKSCWSQLYTVLENEGMNCFQRSHVFWTYLPCCTWFFSYFCCLFIILAWLKLFPHRCCVPSNGLGKENVCCLLPHCGEQEVWQMIRRVRKSTQGTGISAISVDLTKQRALT